MPPPIFTATIRGLVARVPPAVLLVASLATAAPQLAAQEPDRDLKARRTAELFAEWDRPGSPGCTVGVVHDGQLVFSQGYGMANLDYDLPLTPQSAFYIASTSKQFAAASIAQLALDKALSLDDDIRTYVPELPAYDTPITIRHLVHHTSGLRDYLTLRGLSGRSFEDYFDNDWGLKVLARQKAPNFPAGERFLYSNSGYLLLAEIVERVSGQTLQEFGRERFFEPLGMASTRWGDDRKRIVPGRVVSYDGAAEKGFRRWVWNFHARGDGNLWTTVEDLARWDQMFYEKERRWRRLANLMLTRGKTQAGETLDYAFGLFHGEYRGLKTVGHGGGFLGFRTDMLRFPERRFTAICLCNLSSMAPNQFVQHLADIWLFNDTTPRLATASHAESKPAIRLPVAELTRFTGVYVNPESELGPVRISIRDSSLVVEALGSQLALAPVAATVFKTVEGTPAELAFELDGRPRLHLTAPGLERQTLVRTEVDSVEVDLSVYAGEYYSPELDATYALAYERGMLYATVPSEQPQRLQPIDRDAFSLRQTTLHFRRGPSQEILGFDLDAGRVIGLRFDRRRSSP